MKIWTTGIIEAEVNDAFFETRKFFQNELNSICAGIIVGDAVSEIRIVFVINRDDVSEFKRFLKKDKVLDIRVRINYEEFKDSFKEHRIKMFVNALTYMVQDFNLFDRNEFDKQKLVDHIRQISLS